ncbi:Detected protein of unknown function [Hibiscus syriacus]|uniref:Uncharacterized protein n=1 Tax=Hibiscus syriacus TaxID=106335 RepID=A0A6A2YHX8_HIBSY|nr:Detected protein of unknown function [Hibiscus syriacus]
MARSSLVLLLVIVALIFHPTCFEARKLSKFKGNFVGTTLSKEPAKMFPAGDDDKGHAMANNERLIAIHLAKIDRILQSHPSPGGGHH